MSGAGSRSVSNAGEPYWTQSRQPWASLLFVIPFLALYEFGLWVGAPRPERNGADRWIRQTLYDWGVAHDWLLPLLAPILLLAWHFWSRRPWRCRMGTLGGMLAESLTCAMLLVLFGKALNAAAPASIETDEVSRAVSYLGAGIYEELLFRLMLLPLGYGVLRFLQLPRRPAMIASAVGGSLLFALAHYVETADILAPRELVTAAGAVLTESGHWFSFWFRVLASLSFCTLFWLRGFGVTVGAHLFYDLIVGVVLGRLR